MMLDTLHDAVADNPGPPDSYVEPAVNLPVYCSGLAKATIRDGALHLMFFIEQDSPNGVERIINLRITMQATAWQATRLRIDEAIAAFKRSFDS
jgi:hypothetical protein